MIGISSSHVDTNVKQFIFHSIKRCAIKVSSFSPIFNLISSVDFDVNELCNLQFMCGQ